MDALTVYQVAQALPMEEQVKLFNMLKTKLTPKINKKSRDENLPEFTDEDALEYLFNFLDIT